MIRTRMMMMRMIEVDDNDGDNSDDDDNGDHATVVLLLVYNYFYWTRMVYAGQNLHDSLIKRMFHAPMAFFDTTPMGRIMNRVSRDIEVVR